jgi:chemotaxis protein methyltransferase CheR/type IV pilus assembly protein PilK
MREVGANDYEEYFQRVSAVPQGAVEWAQLVDRVSVKETSFFRELHSYEAVRSYLLERIEVISQGQDKSLDIWSVGCSTGEEAYSLAMTANDLIDFLAADVFLGVMATDISQSALNTARQGCYSARKLAGLPLAIKHKYFVALNEQQYEIAASLKQRLCFVQGNMLEIRTTPAMTMDVIFCQNVLVYFKRARQKQVLDSLVEHLKPGGLLMIGPGEVVGWQHSQMQRTVNESVQAYIKR